MSIKKDIRDLKLAKIAKLRQEIYRRQPLRWLGERLGEDPKSFKWSDWGSKYEDHVWDGNKDPLAQAWQTFADSYIDVQEGRLPTWKYVGVESATGTGKTYWLARLVVWFLDVFENSLVVTSAPSETQLKLGLWSEISMLYPKIKRIRKSAQLYKLRLAMDEQKGKIEFETDDDLYLSESWHAVGFITGASADEQSSNRARGFHRKNMLIILEEATGIPDSILTAFQNTSTGNMNFILAVGNPDNEFDTLHRFCGQKDTRNFRISAFDYPNIVFQKEIYSGAITQSSINSRTDLYGEDSPLWQAMVRGISPAQSESSLIKLEWIKQCIDTDWEDDIDSQPAVGVDVANSINGDKASVAYGQANHLIKVKEFQCPNATHLAYNLYMDDAELLSRGYRVYKLDKLYDYDIEGEYVGIDAVGVGVATVNAFLDDDFNVVSLQGGEWKDAIPSEVRWVGGKKQEVPRYRFANLRTQMYWELREDLRNRKINIKIDDKVLLDQIKKELAIPKIKGNDGVLTLEGKEEIKKRLGGKSPNVADAIVYWNWSRKGYNKHKFKMMAISAG